MSRGGPQHYRYLTIDVTWETYSELASQARQLGYPRGCVSVYLSDRAVQLCDQLVFTGLPPLKRSWPPETEEEKRAKKAARPWFVRD